MRSSAAAGVLVSVAQVDRHAAKTLKLLLT
jgi:hypothetical protein